jgi:hypothetical protein
MRLVRGLLVGTSSIGRDENATRTAQPLTEYRISIPPPRGTNPHADGLYRAPMQTWAIPIDSFKLVTVSRQTRSNPASASNSALAAENLRFYHVSSHEAPTTTGASMSSDDNDNARTPRTEKGIEIIRIWHTTAVGRSRSPRSACPRKSLPSSERSTKKRSSRHE